MIINQAIFAHENKYIMDIIGILKSIGFSYECTILHDFQEYKKSVYESRNLLNNNFNSFVRGDVDSQDWNIESEVLYGKSTKDQVLVVTQLEKLDELENDQCDSSQEAERKNTDLQRPSDMRSIEEDETKVKDSNYTTDPITSSQNSLSNSSDHDADDEK